MTKQAFHHHFSDMKLNLNQHLSIEMHLKNLNKNLLLIEIYY